MKTPEFAADNNVARKTPEEIKNALDLCSQSGCPDCAKCAYDGNECCLEEKSKDALTYIQQLEAELAQTKRERDAAVHDLMNSAPCFVCWHFIRNNGACKGGKRCCDEQFRAEVGATEYDGPEWKWRGVCPENTKEEVKNEVHD